MLHQIDPSEKVINEIQKLFKNLNINQLLRTVNIRKSRGISVQQIFEFVFLLALLGKNQYRFLESKRGQGLRERCLLQFPKQSILCMETFPAYASI